MIMVTNIWRGALHLDEMRIFEDEKTAHEYYLTLSPSERRAYRVETNAPPKLLWSAAIERRKK